MLNFPTIPRMMADAMRANRRPSALMMLPVDWRPDAIPARALVELKFDGIHMGHAAGLEGLPYTREGVEMRCASHLRDELDAISHELRHMTGSSHRLFGEYVNPAGFNETLKDFGRGVGDGIVQLFDCPTERAYNGQEASLPLIERKAMLAAAIAAAGGQGTRYVKDELYVGADRDAIEVLAGSIWADGHEGLVIKDAESPYVRGKSPHWMRLKQRQTIDAPIHDIDVRPDATLKALVVRLASNVFARIGRGFSTDERRDWNKLFRLGDVIEIDHLGTTPTGNLRSASFVRRRTDKKG